MIWSAKCQDCGGSGKRDEKPNFITGSIKPICPTCLGNKEMVLAVKELCPTFIKRGENYYGGCNGCDSIIKCDDNRMIYRPLTVQEVEELCAERETSIEQLILEIAEANKREGELLPVTYKGSPVTLRGRVEG